MKIFFTKVQWLCCMLLCVALLQSGLVVAQNSGGKYVLSGTVLAEGEPLIGATIVEPGTSNGTVTGADGKFSLSLSKRGTDIQVSFIGYVTKTVRASADNMKITLATDSQQIDEVMVVAYGTMRKRDVTGGKMTTKSRS